MLRMQSKQAMIIQRMQAFQQQQHQAPVAQQPSQASGGRTPLRRSSISMGSRLSGTSDAAAVAAAAEQRRQSRGSKRGSDGNSGMLHNGTSITDAATTAASAPSSLAGSPPAAHSTASASAASADAAAIAEMSALFQSLATASVHSPAV